MSVLMGSMRYRDVCAASTRLSGGGLLVGRFCRGMVRSSMFDSAVLVGLLGMAVVVLSLGAFIGRSSR